MIARSDGPRTRSSEADLVINLADLKAPSASTQSNVVIAPKQNLTITETAAQSELWPVSRPRASSLSD